MSSETPPPSGEPTPQQYGEPTPQQYGAPAPQQYGAPMPQSAAPQNGMGTASLVMGILQFFLLGPIGSVLAIVFGRIGINRVKRGEANNGGVAKAGFWLGIVGLILSVVAVVIIVATGAFVFKEAVKSINESTDPAKNSQTGLADGDYQMAPTSAEGLNDKCGFEGPAVAAATGETSSGNVLVVGQGVTDCSTSVSVAFTVTGGVATITSTSSGGTQTGQAAAPTQDSPSAGVSPGFSLAKNAQTGLTDGDYVMEPVSKGLEGGTMACVFDGPAGNTVTGDITAGDISVVGQGASACGRYDDIKKILFTVAGGTATITQVQDFAGNPLSP